MHFETTAALFDELEKVAYGPKDISKILRLSKRRLIHAPVRSELGQAGPTAFPTGAIREVMASGRRAARMSKDTELYPQITKELGQQANIYKQVGNRVFVPRGGKGGMGHIGRVVPDVKKIPMTGKQRRAAESVVRGHEMDELLVGRRKGGLQSAMAEHGHMSPDVILRERNRVVTMPKDMQPVRDAFQTLRKSGPRGGEAGLLERATRNTHPSGRVLRPGIQFGSGQRLSRHARKRVSALMEAQGVKERGVFG